MACASKKSQQQESSPPASEDASETPEDTAAVAATGDVVYVCGDSHTLTPAWHRVTVGQRYDVLRAITLPVWLVFPLLIPVQFYLAVFASNGRQVRPRRDSCD